MTHRIRFDHWRRDPAGFCAAAADKLGGTSRKILCGDQLKISIAIDGPDIIDEIAALSRTP